MILFYYGINFSWHLTRTKTRILRPWQDSNLWLHKSTMWVNPLSCVETHGGQRRGLILCTARISNTELYNFRTYFRCGFCVIGYNRSAHIIFFLDKASCKLLEQYMLYAILVQCFFQNETYSTVFISIYYDKCCITSTWVFFFWADQNTDRFL